MATFGLILVWLLIAGELLLAGPVFYLCIVSISAVVKHHKCGKPIPLDHAGDRLAKFAIFIPAHNEETTISNLLSNLGSLDYPQKLFDVFVIADNCTDQTAAISRQFAGVQVYERHNLSQRGKGYGLNWMWQQLDEGQQAFDAYVIVDADSVMNAGFLQAMNCELRNGAVAMQARNLVLNSTASPSAALRWVALALMNFVRPLGRTGLGGSANLSGNGMCLSRSLIERYPWRAFGLGEDYQYYLQLVEQGIAVTFVPDASVHSEMPLSFAQMRTQDVRWEAAEQGQSDWQIAGKLICDGMLHRSLVRFDAAAELLTPPLSLLGISCVAFVIMAMVLSSTGALAIALSLSAGMAFYVLTAFYLLRPPAAVYKSLLHAPGFVLWKLWVIFVLSKSRKHTKEWVRTARNPS